MLILLVIGIGGTDGRTPDLALRASPRLAEESGDILLLLRRGVAARPPEQVPGSQLDAAVTWAASRMRPGRVEAVGGVWRIVPVASSFGDSAPRGRQSNVSQVWQREAASAIICADEWACFRQGYRDFGGNPEWEDRFVDVIETCESEGYGWADVYPLYLSRAQFDPDSWRRAAGMSGLYDPADPYTVGANVAVWSNAIAHPGGSGGWGGCWRRTAGLDRLKYSE